MYKTGNNREKKRTLKHTQMFIYNILYTNIHLLMNITYALSYSVCLIDVIIILISVFPEKKEWKLFQLNNNYIKNFWCEQSTTILNNISVTEWYFLNVCILFP